MQKRNQLTDQHVEYELLLRLKQGESEAVREWYSAYHPRLAEFVAQRVDDLHDVEHIVNEVFLNALKQLPLFIGKSSVLTWMLSIARHEVADFYRKKYAKKVLAVTPFSELIDATIVVELGLDATGTSSVSGVAGSWRTEQVAEVLEHMDASVKELLLQKYVDKKSVVAIAAELGRSIKAIESELFRARRQFRLVWNRLYEC
jgi:RNA polymerase sigma factor (sigma-70 family)